MPYIGRIETPTDSVKIDPEKWMALIDSHDLLGHVPPVKGINPFTRQPCEYNAPASTARILNRGVRVGSISWALDGSLFLIVDADDASEEFVANVAESVAAALGARFVREAGDDEVPQ